MRATTCLIVLGVFAGSANLPAQQSTVTTAVTPAVATIGTPPGATSAVPRLTSGDGSAAGVRTTGPVTTATLTPGDEPPTVTPTIPVVPIPTVRIVPTPIPLDLTGALRLTNLSTRGRVTPENPLLTGFAIRGTTPLTVLVRAAGPALSAFGVAGAVAAPRLRLRDAGGRMVAENAGWSSAAGIATATATAGAFSFAAGSADSALVAALEPGSYSAEVIAEGGGGVTLIEVYEINGRATGSRLANLSTLGTVAASDGDVISGFVISGADSAAGTVLSRRYLVRAVGPSLAKLGVTGVLADPALAIFNSSGSQVASDDDWSGYAKTNGGISVTITNVTGNVTNGVATGNRDAVDAASNVTGAFALDVGSMDAALVTTLTPGAYTVHMRGVATSVVTFSPGTPSISSIPAAPGVALLEIYELP